MKEGILRKLEQNPELKQAYETLVKHLPEDQREKAMVSIAEPDDAQHHAASNAVRGGRTGLTATKTSRLGSQRL